MAFQMAVNEKYRQEYELKKNRNVKCYVARGGHHDVFSSLHLLDILNLAILLNGSKRLTWFDVLCLVL